MLPVVTCVRCIVVYTFSVTCCYLFEVYCSVYIQCYLLCMISVVCDIISRIMNVALKDAINYRDI